MTIQTDQLVLRSLATGIGSAVPIERRRRFERMSGTCLHLHSASSGRNWLLQTTGDQPVSFELPRTPGGRAAREGGPMKRLLLALLLAAMPRAQNLSFYLDPSSGGLPQSQLTPLPYNYSFADTSVGASTSTIIRVVNNGSTQAAMSVVYIGNASGATVPSDSFTVTGYGLGSVIAPGNYKIFTLNFTPRAQGSVNGYLQGNIAGLPVSIGTLTGVGAAPALSLSCKSSVAAQCSGSTLQPSTTAAINFGNVLTTATVSIPFTLTNNGINALNPQTLVSIATTTNNPSTPFSLSQLPATLAAGGATTLRHLLARYNPNIPHQLDCRYEYFRHPGNGRSQCTGRLEFARYYLYGFHRSAIDCAACYGAELRTGRCRHHNRCE